MKFNSSSSWCSIVVLIIYVISIISVIFCFEAASLLVYNKQKFQNRLPLNKNAFVPKYLHLKVNAKIYTNGEIIFKHVLMLKQCWVTHNMYVKTEVGHL